MNASAHDRTMNNIIRSSEAAFSKVKNGSELSLAREGIYRPEVRVQPTQPRPGVTRHPQWKRPGSQPRHEHLPLCRLAIRALIGGTYMFAGQ